MKYVLTKDLEKLKAFMNTILERTGVKKEEVFDLSKIAIKKEFNSEIEKFIESLQTTTFNDLDLLGIAKEICKRSEVNKEVEDEVLNRITNK